MNEKSMNKPMSERPSIDPGMNPNKNTCDVNTSAACSPYPPDQYLIGECHAIFMDHAKPSYGHEKGKSYTLRTWQIGEEIHCTSGGSIFRYQGMAEFLKNWANISWISPEDKLKAQANLASLLKGEVMRLHAELGFLVDVIKKQETGTFY